MVYLDGWCENRQNASTLSLPLYSCYNTHGGDIAGVQVLSFPSCGDGPGISGSSHGKPVLRVYGELGCRSRWGTLDTGRCLDTPDEQKVNPLMASLRFECSGGSVEVIDGGSSMIESKASSSTILTTAPTTAMTTTMTSVASSRSMDPSTTLRSSLETSSSFMTQVPPSSSPSTTFITTTEPSVQGTWQSPTSGTTFSSASVSSTQSPSPPTTPAASTGEPEALKMGDKVALGIGVSFGVLMVVISLLAWIYPREVRQVGMKIACCGGHMERKEER